MKSFHEHLSTLLREILKSQYNLEVTEPLWELPTKPEFGDLSSTVALRLAAPLKKSPLQIAQEIKPLLEARLSDEVQKIEIIKPGFINVFISQKGVVSFLQELLTKKEAFFRKDTKRNVIMEFVSANPTGPLSIAHGRQAVVGDVIANILEFCGDSVTREYYLNDEGRQIDLLIESVQARMNEIQGKECIIPEGGYQGEYVKSVAQAALDARPHDLRAFILEYMVAAIKEDLGSLGISFNSWASQAKIIRDKKIEEAVLDLRERGCIYDKEGAVWFASTQFGDDKDRVICKSDGEYTYFASDIAYHRQKCQRGAGLLINLWGPDHHGYIGRVKGVIAALGLDADLLNVLIIQLVTIKTKERMSRRKGTAILLSDLAREVGKDTARFYYLVRRNSSHLEFDVDLAMEASMNNPLYYVQYACARIASIFKKTELTGGDLACCEYIREEEEMALVRHLSQFPYAVENAYHTLEPVVVIEYVKALAATFHKFYERNRVLVDDSNVTNARLNLLLATRTVLHCALKILGITPVEQM